MRILLLTTVGMKEVKSDTHPKRFQPYRQSANLLARFVSPGSGH